MKFDSKPPDQLSQETLLGLAYVMTSIKDAAGAGSKAKNITIETHALGVTPKNSRLPISQPTLQTAESAKDTILEYLQKQGAIETFIHLPPNAEHMDYSVTVQQDVFNAFYDKVMLLIIPYMSEVMSLNSKLTSESRALKKRIPASKSVGTTAPLPEVLTKLGDDFAVHKGHVISYRGQEIPLELQVAKVVAYIMQRSAKNDYTPISMLSAEVLYDDHDYEEPEKYIVKMVSDARREFKNFIKTQHNYFPNKRGYGYLFSY